MWGGVGRDGNDGSAMDAQHAWNTLNHADDVVGPGDTVYIKGTFGNTLLDSSSRGNGTSWSQPVTYRVFDESGADFLMSSWHGFEFRETKKFVVLDGRHDSVPSVRLYASNTSCANALQLAGDSLKVSGLSINPQDKQHRCGKGMHIGSVRPEVNATAEDIEVFENVISNGNHGDYRETIYIGTFDSPDRADRVDIHHNDIFNIGTSGQSYPTDYQVDIIDIKPCVQGRIAVHDNFLKISDNSREFAIHGNVDIYDNVIDASERTALDKGIFLFHDYPAVSHIYRNIVIGAPGQSIVWLCCGGNDRRTVNVYNNIFTGFGGSGSYIVTYASAGNRGRFNFYHNTFGDSPGLRGIEDGSSVAGTYVFKNNLWNTWGNYALTDGADMDSTWDGNHYYKSGVSPDASAFRWNGQAKSFNQIQNSGQETSGTFGVDPDLDGAGRLQASLPVQVDVSSEMSSWPGYDTDVDKNVRSGTWDVGAVQFGETNCGDGDCQSDESCASCPGDCLQAGQVCCSGVAYPGDCCQDGDCTSPDTCIDHQCTPAACPDGDSLACYEGPAGTEDVGICRGGSRTCSGGAWGSCENQVLPGAEVCGDGVDQDCNGADLQCDCPDVDGDGYANASCGGSDCNDSDPDVHPGAAEVCDDGLDNDCDQLVDAEDGQECEETEVNGECGCAGTAESPLGALFGLLWLAFRRSGRRGKGVAR